MAVSTATLMSIGTGTVTPAPVMVTVARQTDETESVCAPFVANSWVGRGVGGVAGTARAEISLVGRVPVLDQPGDTGHRESADVAAI